MIDRIAPTHRPDKPVAGRQSWRDLLFLHWSVPAESLRPLIPRDLSLDLFEGQAYVGLVPFAMEGVRPRYWPEALGFRFLETNVRTYVHYKGRDPGVYFFSLDAASWLAVKAARLFWKLPYYYAKMRMDKNSGIIKYDSVRQGEPKAKLQTSYRIGNSLGISQPNTLEHFLLERYLLYTQHRGLLRRGQVHHSPYPVQSGELLQLEEGLVAAAGIKKLESYPPLLHYSQGVDVEIFALQSV